MAAAAAAAAAAATAALVLTPADPDLDGPALEWFLSGPCVPEPEGRGPAQYFDIPQQMLMDRPPKFEMLQRNMWVSRRPPKRVNKDEISICSCR
jgi:hypothetical protein